MTRKNKGGNDKPRREKAPKPDAQESKKTKGKKPVVEDLPEQTDPTALRGYLTTLPENLGGQEEQPTPDAPMHGEEENDHKMVIEEPDPPASAQPVLRHQPVLQPIPEEPAEQGAFEGQVARATHQEQPGRVVPDEQSQHVHANVSPRQVVEVGRQGFWAQTAGASLPGLPEANAAQEEQFMVLQARALPQGDRPAPPMIGRPATAAHDAQRNLPVGSEVNVPVYGKLRAIRLKKQLYAELSKTYYLPKLNTSAVTIDMMERFKASAHFFMLQAAVLRQKVHVKCVSSILSLDEIHDFVEYWVYTFTGKFFPFLGKADARWYCVVSAHVCPELHKLIYHESDEDIVKFLGTATLANDYQIEYARSLGPFLNSNSVRIRQQVAAKLQFARNHAKATVLDMRSSGSAIRTRLLKLRDMAFRILKQALAASKAKENLALRFERRKTEICESLMISGPPKSGSLSEHERLIQKIKNTDLNQISANTYFEITGLRKLDLSTFKGRVTDAGKQVESLIRNEFTITSHDDPAKAELIVRYYNQIHASSSNDYSYHGPFENLLFKQHTTSHKYQVPFQREVARQILQEPTIQPGMIEIGKVLLSLMEHKDIVASFKPLFEGFQTPSGRDELVKRVHQMGANYILYRILRQQDSFDKQQLSSIFDVPTSMKDLREFCYNLTTDVIRQVFNATDSRIIESFILNLLTNQQLDQPYTLAAMNYFQKQDKVEAFWKKMLETTKYREIADVLCMFTPHRQLVKNITIHFIGDYLDMLVKLVYKLTYFTRDKLLVQSYLSLITKVEPIELIMTDAKIHRENIDTLLSESISKDKTISIILFIHDRVIRQINKDRESTRETTRGRTLEYYVIMGIPVVAIGKDYMLNATAQEMGINETNSTAFSSIIDSFN